MHARAHSMASLILIQKGCIVFIQCFTRSSLQQQGRVAGPTGKDLKTGPDRHSSHTAATATSSQSLTGPVATAALEIPLLFGPALACGLVRAHWT